MNVVKPAPAKILLVTSSKPIMPRQITNNVIVRTKDIMLKTKFGDQWVVRFRNDKLFSIFI
jgi:hypothetical protein